MDYDSIASGLHLISEEEFEAGLRRLESDLEKGPVEGLSEYVCVWARPGG
jgi:hypothetical protein